MDKVNLREKFALFSAHWIPKIVGELNGQQVKLVKFQGPFVWHHRPVPDGALFEPATTLNTGNTTGELTAATLERL